MFAKAVVLLVHVVACSGIAEVCSKGLCPDSDRIVMLQRLAEAGDSQSHDSTLAQPPDATWTSDQSAKAHEGGSMQPSAEKVAKKEHVVSADELMGQLGEEKEKVAPAHKQVAPTAMFRTQDVHSHKHESEVEAVATSLKPSSSPSKQRQELAEFSKADSKHASKHMNEELAEISKADSKHASKHMNEELHEQQQVVTASHEAADDAGTQAVEQSAAAALKTNNVMYEDVESQITRLATHLQQQRAISKETLAKQRAAFEQELLDQREATLQQERENGHIADDIADLQSHNTAKRAEAERFVKANQRLKQEVEAIRSNISLAMEFADSTLDGTNELMNMSTDNLRVLAELADADDRMAKEEHHKRQLANVAGGNQHLSALQTSFTEKDLLKSLAEGLEKIKVDQNASEAVLRQTFEEEMHKMIGQYNATMLKQAELNQTRISEMDLSDKLDHAVKHLKKTNDLLITRSSALRTFAQRLGATPFPKSSHHHSDAALLQFNNSNLPKAKEVFEKPNSVLHAMTGELGALQEHLRQEEERGHAELHKQKKLYEDALREQQERIQAMVQNNTQLNGDIDALLATNHKLRASSKLFTVDNAKLREKLDALRANMSTATEFTATALQDAESQLNQAKEVEVLSELDALEKEQHAKDEHEGRLKKIAGALLQRESAATHPDAEQLLALMRTTLSELATQQNASMAQLKSQFDDAMAKGDLKLAELQKEQDRLVVLKADQSSLNTRLQEANDHLSELHGNLEREVNALQSFMVRLGSVGEVRAHKFQHVAAKPKEHTASKDANATDADKDKKTDVVEQSSETSGDEEALAKDGHEHQHKHKHSSEDKASNGNASESTANKAKTQPHLESFKDWVKSLIPGK